MDVAAILQQAGFEVEEAGNCDEALRKLNGGCRRLGALVTDVQMPGAMDGYALAKQVHELFPQAAIVVISGLTRPALEEMPPTATFLVKPISPEHLLKALKSVLEHKSH
jgi:DNA-binding NtrC family response regulator